MKVRSAECGVRNGGSAADSAASAPQQEGARGSARRFVIVANPAAGRGRHGGLAREVLALLKNADGGRCSAELCWTSRAGDAESIARDAVRSAPAGEPVCVVAAGGDGTVQEVANALARAGTVDGPSAALGLLPAGRCNDFASAFGIRAEPDHVVEVLLRGAVRSVDLGRINERYFCTVAAMGFDAAVSRFVHEMWMPLRGTLAYVYGVVRMLPRYQPPEVRLTFDEGTREGPLFLAASGNTSSYGGRMKIVPSARPDDGMLDVCVVAPMRSLRVLRLLRRVLDGAHLSLPEVNVVQTRVLRIESEPPQEVWADGELVTCTPVTIEAIAGAIDVLTPRTS